eukprot:augustus_masked-scaffold_2-processed-gene-10.6-mRNA-1 protein AED:0.01 eAED:0.02 QI:0/-1/0/1/-1/1/1/0/213
MFSDKIQHFETGKYDKEVTLLPDKEYGLALDCLVKACTDLFIVQNDKEGLRVLLGRRRVFPQKDWWFGCGGRMRPGETIEKSSARLLNRELGLDFGKLKFGIVGVYSFLWGDREQQPQENGTADISVVVRVVLNSEEVEIINKKRFDEKEYEKVEWVLVNDVLEGEYHPALKQCCKDFLQKEDFYQIRTLAEKKDVDDSEIGRRFRDFVSKFC